MSPPTSEWLRRIYPHNPLYLVSATIVLYGIHLVSLGQDPNSSNLTTSLLVAYVIMLAMAGWLVIRFGRGWEDGRTILLVVLLMFTAISTSYDLLCLNDPKEGATRLAIALAFCALVVEVVLAALGIRLPLVYRIPFYAQLSCLFAFPAVLGQFSIDGREALMCLGVLAFSAVSGAAILLLLPAIQSDSLRDHDNGTPWQWPYYPWSIFVFMALAMGIRLWMLSVSFTHARGLEPAFHPYFLSPLLLAVVVLMIEAGLKYNSRYLQRAALASLPAIVALSFPGNVSKTQSLSLEFLETSLAGPPLLIAIAATAVGLFAAIRKASWSLPVSFVCLLLVACLNPTSRTFGDLQYPAFWFQLAAIAWLTWRGLWQVGLPYLSAAAALGLGLAAIHSDASWVSNNNGMLGVAAWAVLTLTFAMFCRDRLSEWIRMYAPAVLAVVGTYIVLAFPPPWWTASQEAKTYIVSGLAGFSIAFCLIERVRWHLVTIAMLVAEVFTSAVGQLLQEVVDLKTRRGLMWYAIGCGVLLLATLVSFWKAGMGKQVILWLVQRPGQSTEEEAA